MKKTNPNQHFIPFKNLEKDIILPEKFTFPFYYEPHPLCVKAAEELQTYISEQNKNWAHNFGLLEGKKGHIIGKMFGVLVVKNKENELGFLAAFSGKLADKNNHPVFVPPVFDMLTEEDSFFNLGMKELNKMSAKIQELKENPKLKEAKDFYEQESNIQKAEIEAHREKMRQAKKNRKQIRTEAQNKLGETDFNLLKEKLAKESLNYQYQLKHLTQYWEARIYLAKEKFEDLNNEIIELKEKRKQTSNDLQQQLFDEYNFLNKAGEYKNVREIFEQTVVKIPPAGAGECAAPKLLQYAFKNQLQPIAMAEFWWGKSPNDEVRKHKQFYPACRGKCEPILAHMLEGIPLEENPMLTNPAEGKSIEIIHEEDSFLVINKPAEFLSVPGKHIQDSVWLRIKHRFPNAKGALIVHRLDMSTSGLMLISKTKEANKILQGQFINRTVKKRYTALLDGKIEHKEGTINLPLRVDLDNRPRQLVCYKHGKNATTKYKVIEENNNKTLIHFYPITGRTHQLRMHAAHANGLNAPIVGDDLYGTKANRLHLHAAYIAFNHPITNERMEFELEACFDYAQQPKNTE